ncbi:MAG: DNA recombination protein RmuC [Pseudomonadota bacterium]
MSDPLLWVAACIGAALVAGLVLLWQRLVASKLGHARLETELSGAQTQLAHYDQTIAALQDELKQAQNDVIRYQTRLKDEARGQAEREAASQQIIDSGKIMVAETLGKLSDKLISDHKREAKTVLDQSEQNLKTHTDALNKQVTSITQMVQTMQGEARRDRHFVDTVRRAISEPQAAGQMSEALLERYLISQGLEQGRNFVLQPSLSDADQTRLRPDCLILMPDDTVLVIDCKSSKFLIDLPQSTDEMADLDHDGTQEAGRDFARAMDRHLKSLIDKDYKGAVHDLYDQVKVKGAKKRPSRIITLLWLPYDVALERLRAADSAFAERAAMNGIYVIGPSGLWAALGVAVAGIEHQRRLDNQQIIVDECANLISAIATSLDHAGKIRNGLRQAMKGFDHFARSANSRLIPRTRTMIELGVTKPKKMVQSHIQLLDDHQPVIDSASDMPPSITSDQE